MKNRQSHARILISLTAAVLTCQLVGAADLRQDFVDPPLKYATRPLWFWNNTTVTEEGIVEQMQAGPRQVRLRGLRHSALRRRIQTRPTSPKITSRCMALP